MFQLIRESLKGKSSAIRWRNIWCQSTIRNLLADIAISFSTLSCERHSYCARTCSSLTQPLHCDLQTLSCKTEKHSVKKQTGKVTWTSQLHYARSSRQIRWQSKHRRYRRATEPAFLRSGTLFYRKKKNNVPRKSWLSNRILDVANPNAIRQQWLAQHNQNRNFSARLYSTLIDSALLYSKVEEG